MNDKTPSFEATQKYIFYKAFDAVSQGNLQGIVRDHMKAVSKALGVDTYFVGSPKTIETLSEEAIVSGAIKSTGRHTGCIAENGKRDIIFFERTFPKTAQKVIATLGLR